MKKVLALVLAVLLVFCLFAGCGGTGTTTPDAGSSGTTNSGTANSGTTNSGTSTPDDSGSSDAAVDEGPYKFAAGKFEMDERGIAQTPYVYDVPFCTSDEVLTYWTGNWTPSLIPEEGFTSMEYPQMLKQMTGVHVEWNIAPSNNRSEQYSVLLASDDLFDMMGNAGSYHPDPINIAIEDGYYVNLYEYRDYIPNYTYQIKKWNYDKDVLNKIFYEPTTIGFFYGMLNDPAPPMGYCMRGDFLDKLGMKAADIDTYDEVHGALVAIKSAGYSEFPMDIIQAVEGHPGILAGGHGTFLYNQAGNLPKARVVDGNVEFTLTTEDDRTAMTMLTGWYADGLINPNWGSCATAADFGDRLGTDESAYCYFQPSIISSTESNNDNPDCRWDYLCKPRVNSGDKLKIGTKVNMFSYSSTAINAKGPNIPLAVTWCDWFYSEYGSFHSSYGPEGLTYTYNENGDIRLTDFVLHHESGTPAAFMLTTYGTSGLSECGVLHNLRDCCYEGGDFQIEWNKGWAEPSGDINYDWPLSCKFTPEEDEELALLGGDLTTYITETWTAFVDGSAPMTEWDAYVEGCYAISLERVIEIYQAAYDRFMAS